MHGLVHHNYIPMNIITLVWCFKNTQAFMIDDIVKEVLFMTMAVSYYPMTALLYV